MPDQSTISPNPPRQLGPSVLAILAGFVAVVLLSLGTDVLLHALKVFGEHMTDRLFMLATVYRTIYGVIGSYITARVAPCLPMAHALVGGVIGLALSTLGAVMSWRRPELGPHWYPVALVITAMPSAWIGGKIREMQISH
ncbi:MAG: hypothetical protein ACRD3B_11305 [Candidatus Sulfotelmatobacter sp.]